MFNTSFLRMSSDFARNRVGSVYGLADRIWVPAQSGIKISIPGDWSNLNR